ncbi:tape measure protein [Anaerocolumna sp. MB42-C2]|uniref:tape measure protein n=1 Tax=Anaerocolumna sp. MB42-C2 TaxID=3070997 RepID=UPI0027DFA742|nr:tape measure protein [Anaerocolumna sp. MB42-C2]WMJ90627.1 tape measure protein [Anaerocolumna sp. MB42-C2]
MADISAVFVSINMYSSTLDKLIKKTDEAVDKLIKVTGNTKKAVDNMKTASLIADKAAAKMQKSTNGLNNMVNKMTKVGTSTEKITDKLQTAGAATGKIVNKIQGAASSIGKTGDKLEKASDNTKIATENFFKASDAVDQLNGKLDDSKDSAESAGGGLGKLFGSVFNLDNMQKGMQFVDNMAKTKTKLGLITDKGQSSDELQNKIFAAAGNSRGSFADMAGSVTKLESTTGDLFKTNDETIAFTELAQRSFVAGGGSNEERSASMDQLTDSMAGDGLKGDSLTSLAQTAPAIVDAISSYTGKTGNDLKALADQGGITADVIKNSMFAASDQINNSFAEAPMTFEDIWTRIQDAGLQAFTGIMEKITEFISNPEFGQFINGLVIGIDTLVDGISWLIGLIANGWSVIGPILAVIGTVLLIQMIAGLWAMVPPVIAQAVAWMIASLPLLIFIGLIALAVMAAINMGVSFEDIFGFIGGLIGGLGTVFNNIFVFIWNLVADFVNFFGNAFNNATLGIRKTFLDLAIAVLNIVEGMVHSIESLINRIPGVEINISDGIANYKNKLIEQTKNLKTEADYKKFIDNKDYKDVGEGIDNGANKAKSIFDKAKNGFGSLPDGSYTPYSGKDNGVLPEGKFPADPSQPFNPSSPMPVEGTGPDGSMNVEMPDDDLGYLRSIAERDYIANVATNSLAPNISVQFGDVHENADANKVAGRIREILQNEIAMASEGVY